MLLVIPAPLSIFEAIRKLPAGHVLLADEFGVSQRPYADQRPQFEAYEVAEMRRHSRLRELSFGRSKATRRGCSTRRFLSGGLDSSLIVAIMSRLMPKPVKTLSVGFEDLNRMMSGLLPAKWPDIAAPSTTRSH